MIDNMLVLSDAQAVVGDTGDDVASTKVLNLGKAGEGYNDMSVIARVNTAYASGAGTLQAVLQHAPDSSGSPGTYADAVKGPVIARASLTQGKLLLNSPLPPDLNPHVRIQYLVGGEALTAIAGGKVDAWLDVKPITEKMDNS